MIKPPKIVVPELVFDSYDKQKLIDMLSYFYHRLWVQKLRLFFSKPDIEILAGAKNGQKILASEIKMVDVHQPI